MTKEQIKYINFPHERKENLIIRMITIFIITSIIWGMVAVAVNAIPKIRDYPSVYLFNYKDKLN